MKQCPKCNANISDTAKFCPMCGCNIKKYKEENNKQNKIYCQECGSELEKGTMFCTECGSKISSFEQVQNSDIFNDDFLSNIDFSTSQKIEEKEIEELFSQFEYEKHMDGTYTIIGLKDKSAFNYNIPEKVVSIGEYAFENCKVNKIDLPDGIIEIAEGAFKECIYLEKINLPKSLRFIGKEAFLNCSLLELEIPNNIRIGKDAIKNTLTYNKKKEKEEAERKAREEQERKAREEVVRKAREEVVRKAEEERIRKEKEEAIKKANETNVGNIRTFGSYFIDNSNAKQPIEWIILEKNGNNLLLISKYGIDCKKYDSIHDYVTWETCDLREWLNNEFLNTAFANSEQNMILNTRVHTNDNSKYGASGGNDTVDKVFLLSIEEVEKYFSSSEKRKCQSTNFAKANGTFTDNNGICYWWLRSPGYNQGIAAGVNYDGDVYYCGSGVTYDNGCVRPALWINLES